MQIDIFIDDFETMIMTLSFRINIKSKVLFVFIIRLLNLFLVEFLKICKRKSPQEWF